MRLNDALAGRPHKGHASAAAALSKRHLELVRAACAYIDERDGQGVTLARLAEAVGLSPWHLQRLFKKAIGLSPRDYADARRSRRFRDELKDGESIAGATYGAGYGSSSRVYERAKTKLGMTPASYAKGGKGARIAYGIVDSPLGRLLLAATAKGVCFVALGDDDRTLEERLHGEFPEADEIAHDDRTIAPAADALLRHQPGGHRRALPPGATRRRPSRRLPLGPGAQGGPVDERGGARARLISRT